MQENKPFKSGFVSLAGRPNVGKSTLINHIMQQKIAAASPRPQTTQRRQLGILTLEDAQIIFMDTPGIHKPVHKLGDFMNQTAFQTLSDADVIVWMVDASEAPKHEDKLAAERIAAVQPLPPVLLALNKIDLISADQLQRRERAFWELLPEASPWRSAPPTVREKMPCWMQSLTACRKAQNTTMKNKSPTCMNARSQPT